MGKNKLKRWAEMENYDHVVQPLFEEVFRKDYILKGKWNKDFFKNDRPIVLELGCGKGEYTLAMAKSFPEINFLGVDIKGARIWTGAREALNENIKNAAFLRTRIELIESFFTRDEISEIWITFPDPQIKKRRNKKRLTAARFINMYRSFVKNGGTIHLKTDSIELFDYTNELLKFNRIKPDLASRNLYSGEVESDLLKIRTHYEQLFLNEGKKITYTKFRLDTSKELNELPETDE